ncbi:hypothetical protein VNO80_03641 [Phaseolus coccineus]|uniref:Uncharacterized protein n=1 Tax=Phaseolus coccineus TaxID=3886 RepID=A0AAN9NZ93_PHACN
MKMKKVKKNENDNGGVFEIGLLLESTIVNLGFTVQNKISDSIQKNHATFVLKSFRINKDTTPVTLLSLFAVVLLPA